MSKFQIDLLDKAYQGMGLSRYTGFELMKCVDVDDYGVIKLNYKPGLMPAATSQTIDNVPFFLGRGKSGENSSIIIAAIKDQAKYWNTATSAWTSLANVTPNLNTAYPYRGVGFYGGFNSAKDYMIYTGSSTTTNLYAFDCSTATSPSVDTSFITTMEANSIYRPFFTSATANKLFIGNRRYLAEIAEVDGQTFDPATAGTFVFTPKKLDLASAYEISCLTEWNEYLVIGTKNLADPSVSDIFLWDMVSSSWDRKISINQPGGVDQVVVYKNFIFINCSSDWFVSLGGAAEKVAQIPRHLLAGGCAVYPNAWCIKNDRIYFGVRGTGISGVWSFDTRIVGESYDPANRGVLPCQYEHTLSNGVTDALIYPLCLLSINTSSFLAGWWRDADTDTYGIDAVDYTSAYGRYVYSSSEGKIISRFYRLAGTTSQSLNSELFLAKPLKTNESVKIYIRNTPGTSYEFGYSAWSTAGGDYSLDDLVLNNGRTYQCISAHTPAAATEPGVGASWRTVWQESWRLYKEITSTDYVGQTIIKCPEIPAIEARTIQFMYVLDAADSQSSGPELLAHILSE
jgi:hypothetical protein